MAGDVLFEPSYGSGVTVSTSSTSTLVTLPNNLKNSLCITNLGSSVVYINVSNSTTRAATTQDLAVLPSNQILVRKSVGQVYLQAMSATAGSLHIIDGGGV